ncbi:ZMYM5 protein, partial [Atractosteus spatula]|nr:ZMYM5 protein [Atractosteus spatula]
FPRDSGHRKLSACHYSRTLANGETLERPWLIYWISKDVTFCFCCHLFGESERKSDLAKDGVKDWKTMSSVLSAHKRSNEHIECFNFTELTDTTGAGTTDVLIMKRGELGIDIMDMSVWLKI